MAEHMQVLGVKETVVTYPTGDPTFSVKQSFPSAFSAEEADPFLMCDFFGPTISRGVATDPDDFPVDWHPHRGMDICTYLNEGVGRHGDSMGNRESYPTPGLQWISVGSGIEHAEAGGTPQGERQTGFQIWINVPSQFKMEAPEYGTNGPEELPVIEAKGVHARLLAGPMENEVGPFHTKQAVLMVDYTFQPSSVTTHSIPANMDNCLVFMYEGEGEVGGAAVPHLHVMRLDASDPSRRLVTFAAGTRGMKVMLFAGKRINEPIAWHGPFVMNTQAEIRATIREYQRGQFPPVRVPWDYKRLSAFPPNHQARSSGASSSSSSSSCEVFAADSSCQAFSRTND